MSSEFDFIIVGQGIAGTLLHWELCQSGRNCLIVDAIDNHSASRVAAGLINPITGRKFHLAWEYDQFYQFAEKKYVQLTELLGIKLLSQVPICRAIEDRFLPDWEERINNPEIRKHVLSTKELEKPKVKINYNWIYIKGARLSISGLLPAYRQILKRDRQILEEKFDYQMIEPGSDEILYKSIKTKAIIFCEGVGVKKNPYFSTIYNPAYNKGEVLTLSIGEYHPRLITKTKHFLIPQEEDTFWWGSFDTWKDTSSMETIKAKRNLVEAFEKNYELNYQIKDHRSAHRPIVKDRRPVLGRHPQFQRLYILNGLGTRGSSLGPLCAHWLVKNILEGTPIPHVVNVNRFAEK